MSMIQVKCGKCGYNFDMYEDERKSCPKCGKVASGPKSESGCFIATAAYGSPLTKELDLLRAWRDVELSSIFFGKKFIETYYQVSPPIARFIAKYDSLRLIVRTLLIVPVYILRRRKLKTEKITW